MVMMDRDKEANNGLYDGYCVGKGNGDGKRNGDGMGYNLWILLLLFLLH